MARRRRTRNAGAATARPRQTVTAPNRPPSRSRFERRVRAVVRSHPFAVAAALVALHVALALITFAPQPHTGGDNAAYITLAQSLLQYGTYTELWDPAAPPHTKYPPVFPLILAGALAIGLQPWVQLKLVVLAFSASAVAFSFFWIRARRRSTLALGVGLLLAIAPGVLQEGRWILSDVPFWTFTMLSLWAFERLRPGDWKRFAIGALALLLAYFTRSAGLPLVLAALAWLGWRRYWRELAALTVIVGVPAVAWWLRGRIVGVAGYTSEFWLVDPYAPALGRIGPTALLERIVENTVQYVGEHMPILLTGSTTSLLALISAVLWLLGIGGWVRRLRAPHVAELFVPLYIGLLFVWPAVWSGERFLLPALPLILFYAGEALAALARRAVAGYGFAVGAGALALLIMFTLPGLSVAAELGRECTAQYRAGDRFPCVDAVWDDFIEVAELTPQMLPEHAVVLSRKPRLFYAFSGHRSSIYPFSTDPADFFATADSINARYVVFDWLGGTSDTYLRPVLLRKSPAFCVMHATPATGTVLFGIRLDHASVPDAGEAGIVNAYAPSFALCDVNYWRNEAAQETFGGS